MRLRIALCDYPKMYAILIALCDYPKMYAILIIQFDYCSATITRLQLDCAIFELFPFRRLLVASIQLTVHTTQVNYRSHSDCMARFMF